MKYKIIQTLINWIELQLELLCFLSSWTHCICLIVTNCIWGLLHYYYDFEKGLVLQKCTVHCIKGRLTLQGHNN